MVGDGGKEGSYITCPFWTKWIFPASLHQGISQYQAFIFQFHNLKEWLHMKKKDKIVVKFSNYLKKGFVLFAFTGLRMGKLPLDETQKSELHFNKAWCVVHLKLQ